MRARSGEQGSSVRSVISVGGPQGIHVESILESGRAPPVHALPVHAPPVALPSLRALPLDVMAPAAAALLSLAAVPMCTVVAVLTGRPWAALALDLLCVLCALAFARLAVKGRSRARAASVEREILTMARQNGGSLTAALAAQWSGRPIDEVERALHALAAGGHILTHVREGYLEYQFPQLMGP